MAVKMLVQRKGSLTVDACDFGWRCGGLRRFILSLSLPEQGGEEFHVDFIAESAAGQPVQAHTFGTNQ